MEYSFEVDKSEYQPDTSESTSLDSRISQAENVAQVDNPIEQKDQAQLERQPQDVPHTAEISGFEQSGVMNNAEAQQYLQENLPAEHISGERITEIRYPNEYNGNDDSLVLGECSTDRETNVSEIDIYSQTPDGSFDHGKMEHTITHEVGHNVYYNLAPEQQSQWNAMSEGSNDSQLVSEYAQTNEREDFAESYAAYVRDPELLQDVHEQKYQFMKNQVFNGREYV